MTMAEIIAVASGASIVGGALLAWLRLYRLQRDDIVRRAKWEAEIEKRLEHLERRRDSLRDWVGDMDKRLDRIEQALARLEGRLSRRD